MWQANVLLWKGKHGKIGLISSSVTLTKGKQDVDSGGTKYSNFSSEIVPLVLEKSPLSLPGLDCDCLGLPLGIPTSDFCPRKWRIV